MITSLRRIAFNTTLHADADLDEAVPTLRHRTEQQGQQVDVTYNLTLHNAQFAAFEVQGTYRVGFTPEAIPSTELAQDTTWAYFRQDTAPTLQSAGFEVDGILPILNPIAPLPGVATPPAATTPIAVPSAPPRDQPTWQGVFPHRFEVARGLMRSLDEVANKKRQWFWSVLRIYAALLLADHLEKEPRQREGITIEVLQRDPEAFQAFFEIETGVRLKAWQGLEEDADRVFFQSLVRNLLVVIHDAVREDSADDVNAGVYDEYLQEVDEYLEEVEASQAEQDEDSEQESQPFTPQKPEGRLKYVLDLANQVMTRPPMDDKLTMITFASKFTSLSMGIPRHSADNAEEAAGYFEVMDKEGQVTHPIRYVYMSNDEKLGFVVEAEIGDDYFAWNGFDKEWLLHGGFPSLKRTRIYTAENEKLPELDATALDKAVAPNSFRWAPESQTVREVLAHLPKTLTNEDLALLGSLAGIDLMVVTSRIDNIAMLREWGKHDDVRARIGVVQNPLVDTDLLTQLANDKSRIVRQVVATHEDCPPAVWEKLSEDAWQVQANLVQFQPLPSELVWRMVHSSNGKGRAAIAEKCGDLPGLFEFLANDADATVRASVAVNPATPTSVLAFLRQDENEAVAELAELRFR